MLTLLLNLFRYKNKNGDEKPLIKIENRIKIIEYVSTIMGWPPYAKTWEPTVNSVFSICLVIYTIICDVILLYGKVNVPEGSTVPDLIESIIFIITQSLALVRVWMIISKRHIYCTIVINLLWRYSAMPMDEKRQKIARNTSQLGYYIFIASLILLGYTAIVFAVRAIVLGKLPLAASGFTIPGADKTETPYYQLYFAIQMWLIIVQCALAFAANNAFCTLAVLICVHLDCLKVDLEELSDAIEIGEPTMPRIKSFVNKHDYIFRMSRRLSDLYSGILGAIPVYASCTIMPCMLLFDGSAQANLFLQISINHCLEAFIYCYLGEMVLGKSIGLSQNIFDGLWYHLSAIEQRNLLVVIRRCQKPFTLDAGIFGPLTRELFAKCMQATYSAFTILNSRT